MFEFEISAHAYAGLVNFINAYEDGFLELYSDTGIVSEDLILEQYHQAAIDLRKRITSTISAHFNQDKILGRKKQGIYYEYALGVGSYIIFIVYREYPWVQTRIIEAIGIDRKPIIF